MTGKTRLGYEGYGVRRNSSFAGKTDSTNGAHPVAIITRLGEGGYGVRRYGSFAGKTPEVVVTPPITAVGDGSDLHYPFANKRPKRLSPDQTADSVQPATDTAIAAAMRSAVQARAQLESAAAVQSDANDIMLRLLLLMSD